MASPMSSIDDNTMGDEINITKQSGTTVTLTTKQKYAPKNIQLTLNVRSAEGTLGGDATEGAATAKIESVSYSGTGKTNLTTSTSAPSGTAGVNYWQIKATATGTAGGYTPKYTISTSGWINSTVNGTKQGVSVSSDTTGKSLYISKASMTVAGSNVVSPSASVAGTTNIVYMNSTDNGIAVTATGGGTASVTATATTDDAGYAPPSTQLGSAVLNAPSKTTTATQYIYKIVVPKDKAFEIVTTADTALDSTSNLTLTNNAFRQTIATNAGTIYARHNTSGKGNLYARAYNESTDQLIITNGAWATTNAGASGTYYGKVTIAAGAYSASVVDHSITTKPKVTGALSGKITTIGTTTQPSGTDGTDYWSVTPSTTLTTTGKSSSKGKATIGTAGYIGTGSVTSSANVIDITPDRANGTTRYLVKAVGSVTMTAGNGTCTYDSATNATISSSTTDPGSGVSVTFKGKGAVSATATTTAGYTPTNNSFATGASTNSNEASLTKYITGVTLQKSTSNRTFDITVPNGSSTVKFTFTVDTNGNVVVT